LPEEARAHRLYLSAIPMRGQEPVPDVSINPGVPMRCQEARAMNSSS